MIVGVDAVKGHFLCPKFGISPPFASYIELSEFLVRWVMKDYIEERAVSLALYIVENKATVRTAAKRFAVSKSTVHKDITERLLSIDRQLSESVSMVLAENKAERHLRGGLATREKYRINKEGH